MPFFSLLASTIRRSAAFNQGRTMSGHLGKGVLLSGAICSGLCIALSVTAILAEQIAFSRVDRDNVLGLSQDNFYAISGWNFLAYDLVHIYVIGIFTLWLVRSLRWEAWVGGSALIVASLADLGSLGVNMFLQMPALSALANGQTVGLPHPEAGFEVIRSTLDFSQASFALVGSFFLASAAMRAPGIPRLAGWFILVGFPIGIFQIAEVGVHTFWTDLVDEWLTPMSEIMQHFVIALCLWELFWQAQRSGGLPAPRLKRRPIF